MEQLDCCFQDEDTKRTKRRSVLRWFRKKEMATISTVPRKCAVFLKMPIKHYATVN